MNNTKYVAGYNIWIEQEGGYFSRVEKYNLRQEIEIAVDCANEVAKEFPGRAIMIERVVWDMDDVGFEKSDCLMIVQYEDGELKIVEDHRGA